MSDTWKHKSKGKQRRQEETEFWGKQDSEYNSWDYAMKRYISDTAENKVDKKMKKEKIYRKQFKKDLESED